MTQTTQEKRLRLRVLRLQCSVAALEKDKKRLENELQAPEAANARLQAARRDALTVHVDMETLERIENMRLNKIAHNIRDRVMRAKPEPQHAVRKKRKKQ